MMILLLRTCRPEGRTIAEKSDALRDFAVPSSRRPSQWNSRAPGIYLLSSQTKGESERARSNLMNAEKLTEFWLNLCLHSLLCDPSANNEFAFVTFSSCQFITLLTCHFFHFFIISSCEHILPPAPSILNAGKLAAPVGEDKMNTGAQPDSHKSLNWWANIQSLISKGLKECSSLCIFHHRHKYVFYEINLVPGQHGVLGAAGLFGEDQVGILLLRCCVACSPWQAGHLSTYSIIIILLIKARFL